MPRPALRIAVVVAVAVLGGLVSGCGADEPQPYNDADVTFASEMVSHHEQALEMADLADDRPLDPAVRSLVDDVRTTQQAEIATMTGWLEQWDKPEPDRDPDAAMDMGGAMDGMMSHAEMDDLGDAADADFQQQWLTLMVEHHRGALEMAQAEVDAGRFPAAVALARSIEAAQGAEITEMERLLAGG